MSFSMTRKIFNHKDLKNSGEIRRSRGAWNLVDSVAIGETTEFVDVGVVLRGGDWAISGAIRSSGAAEIEEFRWG